jgi:putative spermidine/putrescine transport system ATP-binding protein
MPGPADVELIAVQKHYGSVLAVDQVSLAVPAGTYACLLGPSGCGKTTTLRLIAGHEQVTSGDILIGQDNVSDLPPARHGDDVPELRAVSPSQLLGERGV